MAWGGEVQYIYIYIYLYIVVIVNSVGQSWFGTYLVSWGLSQTSLPSAAHKKRRPAAHGDDARFSLCLPSQKKRTVVGDR